MSEDFSAGDGGFVESNAGNTTPGNEWIYAAATTSWTLNGDDNLGAPSRNNLTSPTVSVPGTQPIRISFDHRYSIESEWDGCALFVSINGAAFERVDSAAFVQEGYRAFNLIGNHDLAGLEAFNGESSGYAQGSFITSKADLPGVAVGDTIAVQFVGAFDEFARGALPNWEIDSVTIETLTDSDGDGMPDSYEETHGLDPDVDDSSGDLDGDTLTNFEEFELGTHPGDVDSDDDSLNDNLETNTGTWVSATDTGTDPLDPDSDDDNLADGVENPDLPYDSANAAQQPGSDPNNDDTDGDLARDGLEIERGTDPTNPNSRPQETIITLLGVGTGALIGGDLTDPENDGIEGPTDPGPPQTAGDNFDWVSITASAEEYFTPAGGSEGAFDIFDNTTGGGTAKWCCDAPPQHATVEFAEPVSLTHFVIAASNDTISHARAPLDFEILGSDDGINFTPIYTRQSDTVIWQADEEVYRFDLPRRSDPYTFIRYSVTRANGNNHEIGEIEYFGELGNLLPFEIIDVDYNDAARATTITWNSRLNRIYAVETSEDGLLWTELDDGIASGGDFTSFTESNIPVERTRRFYRARELQ